MVVVILLNLGSVYDLFIARMFVLIEVLNFVHALSSLILRENKNKNVYVIKQTAPTNTVNDVK